MVSWLQSKMNDKDDLHESDFAKWTGMHDMEQGAFDAATEERRDEGVHVDNRPIEPETGRLKGPSLIKWVIFIALIGYMLLSYFRAPILTHLGNYLVVQHPLRKASLIVCTPGNPVEQALMASELFKKGLAPRIFIPDEEPPDGFQTIKDRGLQYLEPSARLVRLLVDLGVPKASCIISHKHVGNLIEEAQMVTGLANNRDYGSLIVITAPYQARRAWLIFNKALGKDDRIIMMAPSRYSGFRAEDWWQKDRYVNRVMMEYRKLFFHVLRSLW